MQIAVAYAGTPPSHVEQSSAREAERELSGLGLRHGQLPGCEGGSMSASCQVRSGKRIERWHSSMVADGLQPMLDLEATLDSE